VCLHGCRPCLSGTLCFTVRTGALDCIVHQHLLMKTKKPRNTITPAELTSRHGLNDSA
jgi:hypothetical protein